MGSRLRTRVSIALACFALAMLQAANTSAKWREGSYMRFSYGESRHELGGLAEAVHEYLLLNNMSGGPVDYDGLSTPFFAVELGAVVSDRFTFGGRFAWHHETLETDHPYVGMDYKVFDLVADVSVAIPSRSGLLLGARAGLSWASINRWTDEWDCTGSSTSLTCSTFKSDKANWSTGSGVVELYSGGQVYISDKFVPFLRAGYAFRDFGSVGKEGFGPDPVNLDFSGWFAEIGFGGILRAD